MYKNRREWSSWGTRILDEHSEELMEYSQILKDKGLIPKIDRYSITRFALVNLLGTLKKRVESITESPTSKE